MAAATPAGVAPMTTTSKSFAWFEAGAVFRAGLLWGSAVESRRLQIKSKNVICVMISLVIFYQTLEVFHLSSAFSFSPVCAAVFAKKVGGFFLHGYVFRYVPIFYLFGPSNKKVQFDPF
jgi:hypothetical protein